MSNNLSTSSITGTVINSSYLTLDKKDEGLKKYAKIAAGTIAFPVLSIAATAESLILTLLTTLAKTTQFFLPKTHSVKFDNHVLNPLLARSFYTPAMATVAFTRTFTNWKPATRERIDTAIVSKAAEFHSSKAINTLRTFHFNGFSIEPKTAEPTPSNPASNPTPVAPKSTNWKKYALMGAGTILGLVIAYKTYTYLTANPPSVPTQPTNTTSYKVGLDWNNNKYFDFQKPEPKAPNLKTCPLRTPLQNGIADVVNGLFDAGPTYVKTNIENLAEHIVTKQQEIEPFTDTVVDSIFAAPTHVWASITSIKEWVANNVAQNWADTEAFEFPPAPTKTSGFLENLGGQAPLFLFSTISTSLLSAASFAVKPFLLTMGRSLRST